MAARSRTNTDEEPKLAHRPKMDLIEEEEKDKDDDDEEEVKKSDDNQGVESLLEPAMDKNMIDIDGNTPLHLAAEQGHLDCLKYLILEALCDV